MDEEESDRFCPGCYCDANWTTGDRGGGDSSLTVALCVTADEQAHPHWRGLMP